MSKPVDKKAEKKMALFLDPKEKGPKRLKALNSYLGLVLFFSSHLGAIVSEIEASTFFLENHSLIWHFFLASISAFEQTKARGKKGFFDL